MNKGSRHATVVGYLALAVALSGSAYAVGTIRSSDIVDNQVTSDDVRDDDLKGGGLSGRDIDEGTLKGINATKLDGKDSTYFARAKAEPWHEIGDPGEPTFADGDNGWFCWWENFDAFHNSAAFFKDQAGVVHLKGLVDSNPQETTGGDCLNGENGGRIFTLPVGYRPSRINVFATLAADQPARVGVHPDGRVTMDPWTGSAEANADQWVSLDGITFRAEQ